MDSVGEFRKVSRQERVVVMAKCKICVRIGQPSKQLRSTGYVVFESAVRDACFWILPYVGKVWSPKQLKLRIPLEVDYSAVRSGSHESRNWVPVTNCHSKSATSKPSSKQDVPCKFPSSRFNGKIDLTSYRCLLQMIPPIFIQGLV